MHAEILATGGEGPPLVYVPGIDGSGELLLSTAARLERRFRLTRLRYAGDASGDHASLAASARERIDSLRCGPVLVLAESFGVSVALRAVLERPASIAGLALVNGFAHFPDRLVLALTRGFFALAPRAWTRRGRAAFVQRGLLSPRRDALALRELLALRGDWFDDGYRARLAWIASLDLRARLPEIQRPVALFAADRDRVVPSVRAAEVMQAALVDVECSVLRDAGHLVLPLAEEPWVERLERLAVRAGLDRGPDPAARPWVSGSEDRPGR